MTEKRLFADVDLPYHVWVREGRRWVLRDASSLAAGEAPLSPAPPPSVPEHRPDPSLPG